jgi:hypothetical protein
VYRADILGVGVAVKVLKLALATTSTDTSPTGVYTGNSNTDDTAAADQQAADQQARALANETRLFNAEMALLTRVMHPNICRLLAVSSGTSQAVTRARTKVHCSRAHTAQ